MRVIAVVSPFGGTGRTTLTAHLAALLVRQGQPCLAVDLCPQNLLGRHLGMQAPSDLGWAALAAAGQWWGEASFGNSDGVQILPFGQASLPTIDAVHQQVHVQPQWLQEQLALLDLPDQATVLLDTPAWPSPLARAALRCADSVLVALEASARSCADPAGLQAMLQASSAAPAAQALLVTRFDSRRLSHREALQTLREQWDERLLPYTLHEDENIPRALAHAMSVDRFAPRSQSAHDLQGVCNWVTGQHPPPLATPGAGATLP